MLLLQLSFANLIFLLSCFMVVAFPSPRENSQRSEQSNLIKSTTVPFSEDKISLYPPPDGRKSLRNLLEDSSPADNDSGVDEIDPKPPILFNSTVYIAGCTRGYLLAGYLPALLANLDTVTSLWADWRLCVYADNASAAVFHFLNDSRVDILYESNYRHNLTTGRYRTERISLGRNACLHSIRRRVLKLNHHLNDTYMIVFDLDDVNNHPMDAEVFRSGVQNLDQWDVLTFHREPYYDYWAARYEGYDENIVKAEDTGTSAEVPAWKRYFAHLKDFGKKVLDTSPLLYFPVYSAFNGLAVYKLNYTQHCSYSWELEGWRGSVKHREECEHVPFHKCVISKNHGKVRIFTRKILNASVDFRADQLVKFAVNFTIPQYLNFTEAGKRADRPVRLGHIT